MTGPSRSPVRVCLPQLVTSTPLSPVLRNRRKSYQSSRCYTQSFVTCTSSARTVMLVNLNILIAHIIYYTSISLVPFLQSSHFTLLVQRSVTLWQTNCELTLVIGLRQLWKLFYSLLTSYSVRIQRIGDFALILYKFTIDTIWYSVYNFACLFSSPFYHPYGPEA